MRLRAQFGFATFLILTRLRAVAVILRRFSSLVFLLLRITQPLLIIFQIAIKRFNFTVVYEVQIVSGGADQVTSCETTTSAPSKSISASVKA